ncbi:MAG: 16S rRNA (guanine(527)-N(7))-methyltransferase RsmG [Actinomycetaceae bacterium]|nr:16S rRNA (guanine(527)-N(7))-methyltransferase RsmG [Arcanobacterium sp.]MDD7505448.1 16S rRNA (guanine(527)-N(7))-methyltransferase RsmG [Actinomycetaceae bacterium]MDY6144053.1 16S rRNA (guanine(527)-N(7))-methyltransferase RsmG [Arcanobacterium sp.]
MNTQRNVQAPPIGGADHFGEQTWQTLLQFAQLLQDEGELRGLVGPREFGKLWDRHILNSLGIEEFLRENSRLIDVGSGAGFPGIVVGIVRPDLKITLVESMERRVQWLEYVVDTLQLNHIDVVRSRAEELRGKISADYVTARAVARLKKLIPWGLPLVKPGGSLLALKGRQAGEEIDEAVAELDRFRVEWADVYHVKVWGSDEMTTVVELRKERK